MEYTYDDLKDYYEDWNVPEEKRILSSISFEKPNKEEDKNK